MARLPRANRRDHTAPCNATHVQQVKGKKGHQIARTASASTTVMADHAWLWLCRGNIWLTKRAFPRRLRGAACELRARLGCDAGLGWIMTG
jgi:hypothetical protein